MNCKICQSSAEYAFSRNLTRDDFLERQLDFYKCKQCGFIFTMAFDAFASEEMDRIYAYPKYLTYDIGAANQRRLHRARALVKYAIETFEFKNPRILMHGNGSCLSPHWLRQEGLDVWTSQDHLADWERRIDPTDTPLKFDVVSSTEVAEHFVDPIKEFSIMADMLRPSGVICGSTCFFDNVNLEDVKNDRYHYTHGYHFNGGLSSLYTVKAMEEISQRLGLKNLTRRGSPELRRVSLMPSDSLFFILQK